MSSVRTSAGPSAPLVRFAAILLTAVVGYAAVDAATTWLREEPSASASGPLTVRGSSVEAQVRSAVRQVRNRHPDVVIDVEGASPSAVRFRVAFSLPDVDPLSRDYNQEISRRIGDSREATLLLLQTIATQVPSVRGFSAFTDLMFVPTWSRDQILRSRDPQEYRDFDTYTRFVMSAETLSGYSQIKTDG